LKWTGGTITSLDKIITGAQDTQCVSVCPRCLAGSWFTARARLHAVTLNTNFSHPPLSRLNSLPLFQHFRVDIVLICRKFPSTRLWRHFTRHRDFSINQSRNTSSTRCKYRVTQQVGLPHPSSGWSGVNTCKRENRVLF
jgi:hypothetical protein